MELDKGVSNMQLLQQGAVPIKKPLIGVTPPH